MVARKAKRPAETTLRLDAGLYSPEAVRSAAAVFAERAEIFLEEGDAAVSVTLRLQGGGAREAERLSGEFLNEALSQDLRLSTVRKNSRLLGMLVAASLRTAIAAVLLCAWVFRSPVAAAAETAPAKEKAPCVNSSPEGIIGGYGLVWGKDVSEQRGIPLKESDGIVERLVDVKACQAVLDGRGDACAELAVVPHAKDRCSGLQSSVPFMLFLAGRSQDPAACRLFFSRSDLGDLSEETFCGAARRVAGREGLPGLCAALTGGRGRGAWKRCAQQFPPDSTSCKDTRDPAECAVRVKLYKALSAQDSRQCPAQARRVCEAALAGPGRDPCGLAAKDLEGVYCKAYRAAWERTRGQVGFTDAQRKSLDEINRRIRPARSGPGSAPREKR